MNFLERFIAGRGSFAAKTNDQPAEAPLVQIIDDPQVTLSCRVANLQLETWRSALSTKVPTHDRVTDALVEQHRLDPTTHHIKLVNPVQVPGGVEFRIELREGPRPISLGHKLYPFEEKK